MVRKKNNSKKSKMSSTNVVLLLIAIALITVFIVSLITGGIRSKKETPFLVQKLDYDFVVMNSLGFNIDTDAVHFGGGHPGFQLTRTVNITVDRPASLVIYSKGPGVISVKNNNFVLPVNKTIALNLSLVIPDNLTYGNYSGELFFEYYNP